MRKSVATAMLAGALLTGGAVGSALFGAGAATAQSSSSSDSSSSAPDSSSSAPNQSDAPPAAPGMPDAPGPRGPHGPHGRGMGPHANLDVAASTIGVTADELRSALQSGQSIADVANSHGVDPQTVIDALVNDAKSHLANEVSNGRLTQAQADQISADLAQRITDLVNHAGAPGSAGCPNMGPDGSSGSSGSSSASGSDTAFNA